MTAQASGRQGWLAPACQLRNRNLFWATNRLTHGLSSAIPDIPSAVFGYIRYRFRARDLFFSMILSTVDLWTLPVNANLTLQSAHSSCMWSMPSLSPNTTQAGLMRRGKESSSILTKTVHSASLEKGGDARMEIS